MNPDLTARRNGAVIAFLAVLLGFGVTSSAQCAPRAAAIWKYIYYPKLEIPTAKGETCLVLVGSGSRDEKPRLRFDMLWSGRDSVKPPDAIMNAGQMSVRLHLPDGTTVEPTNKPDRSPVGVGGAGGITYTRTSFFRWGPNKLDEAWFEFRVDDRTYWIEVPYGFARDPWAALALDELNAGPPALARAMKTIPPDDRIVPWTKIDYDLGLIQNGWRLLVAAANSEDARWLITLYREGEPWKLHEPRTSVKIVHGGVATLAGEQVGARIPDPFRRVDEYSFPTYPEKGRDWGTLTILVDGKPMTAVIPSSLFKHKHAAAVPSHPQRLRVEAPR